MSDKMNEELNYIAEELEEDNQEPSILEEEIELKQATSSGYKININDPVNQYLKQIGRYPLLDAKQETQLAETISLGKEEIRRLATIIREDFPEELLKLDKEYLDNLIKKAIIRNIDKTSYERTEMMFIQDACDKKNLTYQQVLAIMNLVKEKMKKEYYNKGLIINSLKAKDKMISSNLRLVVSYANKYTGQGMSYLDLIQAGNLGLYKAVEKFDVKRGFRFSTYATNWIKQSITRAIMDDSKTIRIPIHTWEMLSQLKKAQRELSQKLNREVKLEEVKNEFPEVSDKRFAELLSCINMDPLSLDMPIGDQNDDGTLMDIVVSDKDITERQFTDELKETLWQALESLSPREREILCLRHGMIDGEDWTLERIGDKYHISRERVRQLEKKAIKKIKNSDAFKKIELLSLASA